VQARPLRPAQWSYVAEGGGDHRAARVLVVDDDPVTCGFCARVLRRAGYEVSLAGDSCSALTLIHSGQPDVVVTDASTHGGLEESRGRLDSFVGFVLAGPRPPLLVLATGLLPSATLVQFMVEHPGIVYLPKPFGPKALVSTVAAAIRARRPA
jgi:two-component system, chemotaxis family, chemotaxis protein CheY